MNCLKCYTVNTDSISEGIAVKGFESVIPTAPDTKKIYTATIQTVPLLASALLKRKTFDKVAETSLSFIKQAAKTDKISNVGVIQDIDPSMWRPCSEDKSFVILDPCGPGNRLLVYMSRDRANALVSTETDDMTQSVSSKTAVAIGKQPRAQLMLDALYAPAVTEEMPE